MRIASAIAALAATFALAACGAKHDAPEETRPSAVAVRGPLLAFVWEAWQAELVEVEPLTLRRASKRSVEVDEPGGGTFSPDGATLALASGEQPRLRFVDVARMRALGDDLLLPGDGWPAQVLWRDPDRLVVLLDGQGARLVTVDPTSRRVVSDRSVSGTVLAVAKTPEALVLLLGPQGRIGPSRIAVVSGDGSIRSGRLDAIYGGRQELESGGDDHRARHLIPGLAVDPLGRRAVVAPPGGVVAEVDLETLAVDYHRLIEPISLLGRLRNWLEPPAEAKSIEGPTRQALWLGRHFVAVTGENWRADDNEEGEPRPDSVPAGLDLIDTRNWSVRTVDRDVSLISPAGRFVLAHGAHRGGTGLAAYGPDGRLRFRILENRPVNWVQVARRHAYVALDEEGRRFLVVDLRSGRLLGKATPPQATTLLETDGR